MSKMSQVVPKGNTLHFTEDLLEPISVAVHSNDPAIFIITMQIIHKSFAHNKTNLIVISEDLSYTVKIDPLASTIFEVVPIFYDFQFIYQASQSVVACALNTTSHKCVNLNETHPKVPEFKYKGQITKVELDSHRKAHVQITNPFSNSVAEVSVIFHSRITTHCENRLIGKLYAETVKNGTCFSYLLTDHTDKDIELYVSKREYESLSYSILICGNSVKGVMTRTFLKLSAKTINGVCEKSSR